MTNTTQALDKVKKLLQDALKAEHSNTEQALALSKEALKVSKEYHLDRYIAESYVRIGRCNWVSGNFQNAIKYLNQGYESANDLGEDYLKAESLIGLGNVYVKMEIYDQATNYYNKSLSISKTNNFIDLEGKILNNLGAMQDDLKNFSVSLKYYHQSLDKAIELDDEYASAIANFNIGYVYLNTDKLLDSERYIQKVVVYATKNDKTILLAHGHHALGRLYQKRSDFKTSVDYLKKALDNAEMSKDLYIQVLIYMDLASSMSSLDDYDKAQVYFRAAFELAKKIGVDELIPRIHEQKAKFYEDHKDIEEAFKHYKAYYDSTKILEQKRLLERVRSVEFQLQLDASLKETQTYRVLSDELKKSYQKMHVLSEVGQSMTAKLNLQEIFNQLYENVNKIMDGISLGVGLYDEDNDALRFELYIEKGNLQDVFSLSLDNKKSWSIWAFSNREMLLINDIEKEYKNYIEEVVQTRGEKMNSAMFVPLIVEDEAIGVLTVQSQKRNAYTETDKDLLQTLASYLAIAIKNAQKSKELAKLNSKLRGLSERDGLTGIPNRRLFDKTYNDCFDKAKDEQYPLGMLMIDIDNFKEFNDSYGHLVGDEVVKSVATHLVTCLEQENDFVARFGGDEFIMLLPGRSVNALTEYANMLQNSLIELCERNKDTLFKENITISIGGATVVPNDDIKKEDLLSFTDQRLYAIKDDGKNSFSVEDYNRKK